MAESYGPGATGYRKTAPFGATVSFPGGSSLRISLPHPFGHCAPRRGAISPKGLGGPPSNPIGALEGLLQPQAGHPIALSHRNSDISGVRRGCRWDGLGTAVGPSLPARPTPHGARVRGTPGRWRADSFLLRGAERVTTANEMRLVRAIPTRYRNILFRSKLEADWARTFDALGLSWSYEREGAYFGRRFYLPDFLLEKSGRYAEVAPTWDQAHDEKALALAANTPRRPFTDEEFAPDIKVVWLGPGGSFRAVAGDRSVECQYVELLRCARCLGWWFCDSGQYWRCQCCGYYDQRRGPATFCELIRSPLLGFPRTPERILVP